MAKKFGVDGSFWDATAVDGKVFVMFAYRIVMNNARNDFLTYTALTNDKHGEVSWSNHEGYLQGTQKTFAFSYNLVSLLYALYCLVVLFQILINITLSIS